MNIIPPIAAMPPAACAVCRHGSPSGPLSHAARLLYPKADRLETVWAEECAWAREHALESVSAYCCACRQTRWISNSEDACEALVAMCHWRKLLHGDFGCAI